MASPSDLLTLSIDGQTLSVPAGSSLLEAARLAGVADIPTLCYDDRLPVYASCFVCVVEAEGVQKLLPSCATPAAEGMRIQTRSPRVLAARRRALELLLSDHYADCLGPCQTACPTGVDVQGYVALVAAGDYLGAARLVREHNSLPAVCGRVCVRKCEVACRRALVDNAVGINLIKRFATDQTTADALRPAVKPPSGRRVAVVGGGPAGLSCADFLAREGHGVTVFEASEAAGGMLRWGIPEYRLPRDLLDQEIQGILDMGVELVTRRRLGRDFSVASLQAEGYEAIFLGLGAQNGAPMRVAGEQLPGVRLGVDFLRASEEQGHPDLSGKRVVVVGGGNTAIDCARSALRCNAAEVQLVYRRTRAEMPANEEEIEAALREGVQATYLSAPVEALGNAQGELVALRCLRMELGAPDASGRRRPVPVDGSEHDIPCELVLAAIGQKVDLEGLEDAHAVGVSRWNTVVVDEASMATGMPGVFAGGDVVLGPSVLIDALGHGRRAAAAIHTYLTGEVRSVDPGFVSRKETAGELSVSELRERIDAGPVAADGRAPLRERHASRWGGDWAEAELTLDEASARREALRCLSCGCSDAFTCHLRALATEYGADLSLTQGEVSRHAVDRRHPFIEIDANKCILCSKCIRTCEQILGASALGLVQRGFATTVQPALGRPLQDTDCIACGSCVDVCPTGALADRGTRSHRGPWRPTWQPMVCAECGLACSLEADFSGGQALLRPRNAETAGLGGACERGRYGQAHLVAEGRLTRPLLRGVDGELHEGDWKEALRRAAEGLAAAGGDVAVLAAPRLANEEAYLAARLARAGLHTDLLGSFDALRRVPEPAALDPLWGLTASTARSADLEQADVIVLCNADPVADHPVLGVALRKAEARGARVVGLGAGEPPLRLAPRPWLRVRRGSLALALAWMQRSLLQGGLVSAPTASRCAGLAELRAALGELDAAGVEGACGLPLAELEALAALLADPALRVVAVCDPERIADAAPDLTLALAQLLTLAGKVGQEGSGLLLPSSGGNLRGLLDQGFWPGRLPGLRRWDRPEDRDAVAQAWGALPPAAAGAPAVLARLAAGDLKAALLLGEDPLGDEALRSQFARPGFLVVAAATLTATAAAADVVLPLATWAETGGSLTAYDRSLRQQRPLLQPPGGRSVLGLLAGLCRRLGVGFAQERVSLDGLYAELAALGGLYPPQIEEGAPWAPAGSGSPLFSAGFATPDGKAALCARVPAVAASAPLLGWSDPLRR